MKKLPFTFNIEDMLKRDDFYIKMYWKCIDYDGEETTCWMEFYKTNSGQYLYDSPSLSDYSVHESSEDMLTCIKERYNTIGNNDGFDGITFMVRFK